MNNDNSIFCLLTAINTVMPVCTEIPTQQQQQNLGN